MPPSAPDEDRVPGPGQLSSQASITSSVEVLRHTRARAGHVMGMSPTSSAADKERTFRAVHADVHRDIERYVRRRAGPEVVDDVLAEVFVVVWRRLDEVPTAPDEARAWIFTVARRVLLTQWRADDRRHALGVRLAAQPSSDHQSSEEIEAVAPRVDLARAWDRLSEVHQEALGLTVFEGLDAVQASAVLDISPVAYRLRLSRARRALRLHLDHPPQRSRSHAATERSTTP